MSRVLSWYRYIGARLEHSRSTARYIGARLEHSRSTAINFLLESIYKKPDSKIQSGGRLKRMPHVFWKTLVNEKLTYLHLDKGGKAMVPIIGTTGATLFVRKIASKRRIRIGDVVVYKDPENLENLLVHRIQGLKGCKVNVFGSPSRLVKDEFWALADNDQISPEEAQDCRVKGFLHLPDVVGRAIYSMRSPVDHGPIRNSHHSTQGDSAVIAIELDIDEMKKLHENLRKP